ncbi:MAG TPA: DUF3500 domain-containing protein [Stellaceae bacterium]|nr:DUF3500 domain-containing protein [Stellaceae bacterium]
MPVEPNRKPGPSALRLEPLPEVLQRLLALGERELAQDFKGITTDGRVIPGLFPISRTGHGTERLCEAATAYLRTLTPEQRRRGSFEVKSPVWRQWCNVHPFLMRHGLCLRDLDAGQREAALALVSETMSASGFETARDIMRLNDYVRDLTGRAEEYDEWYYWMSIMGVPSSSEPWGWQIDGHHLIVNCFVLGDQIVMTPNFMGSEPVAALSGRYAGIRVLQAEESQGLALMRALEPGQREQARIASTLPPELFAAAYRDNLVLDYQGIRWGELSDAQQHLLLELIGTYVGRVRPGHAEVRLEEIRRLLADTWFAWIGAWDDDASPFYYRIHSPAVLIEFDHQAPVVFEGDKRTRDHIHTLVRTPNGNDYGADLLRQHHERHDHSRADSPHRRGEV